MIFQNSNKKLADDTAAVASNDQSAVDQSIQDDQELARVLADIDSQVSANNDSLITDLEKAVEAEQSQMKTESTEVAEAPLTDSSVSFEKIEQETAVESAPVMTEFQPVEVSNNQGSEDTADASKSAEASTTDLNQELEVMNQQISASVTNMETETSTDETIEASDAPEAVTAVDALNMNQSVESDSVAISTDSQPITSLATNEELTSDSAMVGDLDELRKKALSDLRPIVDKVKLNDEESFDVLLLLIRETDDESLLPRAYEAARQIQDEARRAQALLDVIKEADYFKHKA